MTLAIISIHVSLGVEVSKKNGMGFQHAYMGLLHPHARPSVMLEICTGGSLPHRRFPAFHTDFFQISFAKSCIL
jgi:hypothetical protein